MSDEVKRVKYKKKQRDGGIGSNDGVVPGEGNPIGVMVLADKEKTTVWLAT